MTRRKPDTPRERPLTLRDLWDRFDGLEPRLRRMEIAIAVLIVAQVNQKAGGPSVPQIAATVVNYLS